MRKILPFLVVMIALAIPVTTVAQQPTVGSLEVRVLDDNAEPAVGATVSVTGPTGSRAAQADANGMTSFRTLPPGAYRIRVSMTGFATIEVPGVEVSAGQSTKLPVRMTPSTEEVVTVVSSTPLVDPRQLEVTNTFKSEAAESLPIGRNFADSVAFSPGVVSGLGTGQGNYSIGGSSGLENSYVIDGVNITDSGYGGVGTYSIVFGSLGTGVTTDFLDEVQVKTAGFEAEYGQALGGVISGVVKSGTNDFSGAVKIFASPTSMEANGKDVSLPTGAINVHERGETDLGLSMGGPIAKDRAFWFVAYNPVSQSFTSFIEPVANPVVELMSPTALAGYPDPNQHPGAASSREIERDRDNYAVKLNFNATANHWFELTAFGDPSDGDGRSGINASTMVLQGDSNGDGVLDPAANLTPAGFAQFGTTSTIDYGADQQALRYNGLFASDWLVEAQASHRKNDFEETSTVNEFRYRDRRPYLEWLFGNPASGPAAQPLAGGAGFIGPTSDETYDYSVKVSKTFGDHEIKFGAQYFDLEYQQVAVYSGPSFDLPFPDGEGGTIPIPTNNGALVDVRGGIPGCTVCDISVGNPYYRVVRARFGQDPGPVSGKETSFFAQYTGNLTPKLTLKAGLRSTSQELTGAQGDFTLNLTQVGSRAFTSDPLNFSPQTYKFDTELSPRLGLSYDPWGNGKGKAYLHYARYFERVPADLAVRQFSNEVGVSRFEFTDPALTNWRGSSIYLQGIDQGVIQPGTKLPYVDEYVIGWEQLIRPDLSFEIRGIYRDQGRILEDVQFNFAESVQNYYYYYDANDDGVIDINSITEVPFPGYEQLPFGSYVLANPGENTPNLFGSPKREYQAVEVEFNKRMSNNWSFSANYRYAKLRGNYEGLFRNDNGQSDPNITSLFDFPLSPLMRGQFDPGPLNSDRPHVINLYGLYVYDFGLELGGAMQWQSGTPRTPLLAHPTYLNSGEIPGQDPLYGVYDEDLGQWVTQPATGLFLYDYTDSPRGSLGRLPDFASIDLHAGYTAKFSKGMNLKLTLDVFNLFNIQEPNAIDDIVEVTTQIPNVNFNKIQGYQLPRAVRMAALFSW